MGFCYDNVVDDIVLRSFSRNTENIFLIRFIRMFSYFLIFLNFFYWLYTLNWVRSIAAFTKFIINNIFDNNLLNYYLYNLFVFGYTMICSFIKFLISTHQSYFIGERVDCNLDPWYSYNLWGFIPRKIQFVIILIL